MTQYRIPAKLMRGGTSKGLFLAADAVPADPGARDPLLLAALGSPDAYGRQIDGLGGATSSTSKVVLMSRGRREDCDAQFLFGAVAIREPLIDWSGNCGNLTAAAALYALEAGWVRQQVSPRGDAYPVRVRLWQVNTAKRIVVEIPCRNGEAEVEGGFWIDGLPRPGAEIRVTFEDPAGAGSPRGLFPAGGPVTRLVPRSGDPLEATLIDAGNPTVIVRAADLGLAGTEGAGRVDSDLDLLERLEAIRAQAAVAMGLVETAEEATATRPGTPKITFVSPPACYATTSGRALGPEVMDLTARILSMGRLHHAFTGTGAVSMAAAVAIPGTLANEMLVAPLAETDLGRRVRLGHPAGVMVLDVVAGTGPGAVWSLDSVTVGRSARCLMEGVIRVVC